MKKSFILFAVLAVIAAVSCTREERANVVSVSEGELVTFRVGVSSEQTKVTGDMSEGDVNSLQVFVFGSGGSLERSAHVTNAKSVEMTCYSGTKQVVAIVNADDMEPSTIDALNTEVMHLGENSNANFFMYGSETVEVTANGSATIPVARRVARFVLKSVTNEVASSSLSGDLTLGDVYLINVADDARYDGEVSYSPTKWYNESSLDSSHKGSPYDVLYDGIGETLSTGKTYNTQHIFYCCPNLEKGRPSDKRPTRLVLEATLYGTKWYYPIAVDNVESNCSYEVDLTITGAGADSPDSDAKLVSFTFTINVADWNSQSITEKF